MWSFLLIILVIYTPYLLWGQSLHNALKSRGKLNTGIESNLPVPVSIIIPFRNEAGKIENLVSQLISMGIEETNSELILVNDHSEDNGVELITSLIEASDKLSLIHSTLEGKKQALTQGISQASHKWIVTLDADVILPENWLNYVMKVCNSKSHLIILPVGIHPATKFWQRLEAMEFNVLQAITFAYAIKEKPFLANGAHLAFRKDVFHKVNGYSSHQEMASGDDVFLLESVVSSNQFKVGWNYHSDMTVHTPANSTLKEFIHQKIRWSKKTSKFKSKDAKSVAFLVGFANLFVILLFLFGLWRLLLLAWFLKTVTDIFIISHSYSVKTIRNIWFLPVFIIVYPFYFTFVTISTLFITPTWKGRKIT